MRTITSEYNPGSTIYTSQLRYHQDVATNKRDFKELKSYTVSRIPHTPTRSRLSGEVAACHFVLESNGFPVNCGTNG